MTTSSSLLKTLLHKSIAEGLYKEVVSRTSKYYYFLGKTLEWEDEVNPPIPTDSFKYEKEGRKEMITLKEIKPSDVAFVVPRINWVSGTIYDIYDDQYSTEVIGIDLQDGGTEYTSVPTVVIDPPDTVGGLQATAEAVISAGQVVSINMIHTGSGYTNPPNISFTGGGAGTGAFAVGIVSHSPNGFSKLEDSLFYVMTDEYNVYKCLDNNNEGQSIQKPIGTQIAPITLSDGYIWKYMYNVPIALRQKFLTEDQIPVITALSQQFYSAGGIESVNIENRGVEYTAATLTVSGDGYIESDPVYLSNISYTNNGTGYSDGDEAVIAQPMETSGTFASGTSYAQGLKIISAANNIYEIVKAGTTGFNEPTHTSGIVSNGTAALKFIGAIPKTYLTFGAEGSIDSINLLGTIRQVNMVSFGNGYDSNPTITFSPPSITFDGSETTPVSNTITIGSHWFQTGDVVRYSNGGGTTIPGLVNNNQYYIIRGLSTTIKLAQSLVDAEAGTAVDITGAGVGINHQIIQDDSAAQGFADLSPVGVIKRIIITDGGKNYIEAPSVTIGQSWEAEIVVTYGEQYYVSGRLYTVTTAGTTATTAPSGVEIGVEEFGDGDAGLTYVGVAASGTAVLKYGSGYEGNPTISISTTTGSNFSASFTSSKSEARLIAILENGQIVNVQVDDPGIGYSSAAINVSGDGADASILADIGIGNINTLQANNELLTTSGTINLIRPVSQGYGYGTATVTIDGDGSGATATAEIFGGKIVQFHMTNYGSGYTYANITINGNGYGATARAIISPYGGHGKDAYEELFARTLMFYSNVSLDKNQGFEVNNDYRQIGILKNPRKYGETTRFASALGSSCFTIEGAFDVGNFPKDTLITCPRIIDDVLYTRSFRIVSVNSGGTGALIQALDNDPPQVSDVMTNPLNNAFFTVTAVGNPTVDKYSGDMLFIDNKAGFTPSADETVTLRTVIRF